MPKSERNFQTFTAFSEAVLSATFEWFTFYHRLRVSRSNKLTISTNDKITTTNMAVFT